MFSPKKNQEKDGYKNNDLTYHCSNNGNFEPLQCNRGMCYCANVQTGQPVSFAVNAAMWKTLPCCESQIIVLHPFSIEIINNKHKC